MNYFIQNKYTKWYFVLVNKAKERNWSKNSEFYVENHHIIPKSIEKNNDVVCLLAREHFIVHRLLVKMTEGKNRSKMIYALWRLTNGTKEQREHITSRVYQIIKEQYKEVCRKRIGELNPAFGKPRPDLIEYNKTRVISNEHREKLRIASTGKIPNLETRNKMSILHQGQGAKLWKVIEPNGNTNIIRNLSKYCKEHNLDTNNLRQVATGRYVQYRGYKSEMVVQ